MFTYGYERMLELLKIERECIQRNHDGKCDRNCEKCDLVQVDTDLLDMYNKVIRLVERETNRAKRRKAKNKQERMLKKCWDKWVQDT